MRCDGNAISRKTFSSRELFEQLFDMIVRLDHEAYFGVDSGHSLGDIGGNRNGYKPSGVTNASDSLNLLSSEISRFLDTPLYPSTINLRQR